jgi:hypothetical protein
VAATRCRIPLDRQKTFEKDAQTHIVAAFRKKKCRYIYIKPDNFFFYQQLSYLCRKITLAHIARLIFTAQKYRILTTEQVLVHLGAKGRDKVAKLTF